MLRKTLLVVILLSSFTAQAATLNTAFLNISSLTFTQASSAKTSTANLRIAAHVGRFARSLSGLEMPGTAVNSISNYFLTKSMHVSLGDAIEWNAEVDQDTKVYLNGGTNFIKVPSGTRWGTIVYR